MPAAPILQDRNCANHPDRPGLARCMQCQKTVCQECATQWEGIHYCVACLAKRRKAGARADSRSGWLVVGIAVVVLAFLLAHTMLLTGTLLAGM